MVVQITFDSYCFNPIERCSGISHQTNQRLPQPYNGTVPTVHPSSTSPGTHARR